MTRIFRRKFRGWLACFEEEGEGEDNTWPAFSEIVDSLDVKGEARRREGWVGIEARSVFALDYVAWVGEASVCFPRLSEYGRTIV